MEREREEEKHQCGVASHGPPTGDLDHNPGIWPDWESNWWAFGSQAIPQSTEPHQPKLIFAYNKSKQKNTLINIQCVGLCHLLTVYMGYQ